MSEEWDEDEQEAPDDEPDGLPDPVDAETMWLHAAAQYPLLSAEDTVRLARRVAAGSPGVHCLGPWTRDGLRARDTLVEHNLRLIVTVAKHFSLAGTSFAQVDLWQMGVPGLITAAERFDASRGFKFSTSAYWWIRQAISRAYLNEGYLIREPVHNADQRSRARRMARQLTVGLEREPTDEELAAALDMPLQKVKRLQHDRTHVISYDKELSHATERRSPEDTDTLLDRIADPAPTPEQQVTEAASDSLLWQVVREVCTEREAWIIRLRADGYTLEQIGKQAGVSRERIRQIEAKAIKKLVASLKLDAAGTLQRRPTVLHLLSLWQNSPVAVLPDAGKKPRKTSRPAHPATPPTTKNVAREPGPVRPSNEKQSPRERGTSSESITVLSSDESSMTSGQLTRGERRSEAHRKGA